MDKITYLSLPYTFNPELSFAIANEIAAKFMLEGDIVFSPISHCHELSNYIPREQRNTSEFWLKQDIPMLKRCDELVVVIIDDEGMRLIKDSVGCQAEIQCAIENDIHIRYYRYNLAYSVNY